VDIIKMPKVIPHKNNGS